VLTCNICGAKHAFLSLKMSKSKAGGWVCKKCLKWAGLSTFKVSLYTYTTMQIKAMINQVSMQNYAHGLPLSRPPAHGHICSVCGTQFRRLDGGIIKGKSSEWVCRACLEKSGISEMKFRCKDITSGEIMGKINFNAMRNPALQQAGTQIGMHCPVCKSTDLVIMGDTSGQGVSFTKVALFGPLGFSGAGQTQTTNYWVCKKCGNKFRV
jgi:transposase-like protein